VQENTSNVLAGGRFLMCKTHPHNPVSGTIAKIVFHYVHAQAS